MTLLLGRQALQWNTYISKAIESKPASCPQRTVSLYSRDHNPRGSLTMLLLCFREQGPGADPELPRAQLSCLPSGDGKLPAANSKGKEGKINVFSKSGRPIAGCHCQGSPPFETNHWCTALLPGETPLLLFFHFTWLPYKPSAFPANWQAGLGPQGK